MSTVVRLLGRPQVVRDGEPIAVRGRKSWALLAVLVLKGAPMSRSRLASMLFDGADDPLGALRWTLAQLRRSLGPGMQLGGDPVELRPAVGTVIDVEVLERGTWVEAVALPGLGDELLAGLTFRNEAFDAWLTVERARVVNLAVSQLTAAALSQLAHGHPQHAAELAARLVEVQPLDENHHQLVVRALAASGQANAARLHIAAATDLLTRELGFAPGPGLATAAEIGPGSLGAAPAQGRGSVLAQLEAGEAAVAAGATDAGLDCLRRAVHESRALHDPRLEVWALTSLGGALIHGVRGRDTEGAVTLHQAIDVGERAGKPESTAAANRELAWVAVQHGRHHEAQTWLERAAALAEDDAERARILGVRGITLDDEGSHRAAIAALDESARLAAGADHRRQLAWALSMRARTHLQLDEHHAAEALVGEALDLTRRENWNAFLPYPRTQEAELALHAGDIDRARDGFDHAFALACHLGDPCYEALAERGLATVDAGRGDVGSAIARLHDARQRCARHPDTYRWVGAHVLQTMCSIGVAERLPSIEDWIDQLESAAAAAGLRDLVVRAHLHRAALGHKGALAAAKLLAEDLDNPTLLDAAPAGDVVERA